jgi:hypothetical protein
MHKYKSLGMHIVLTGFVHTKLFEESLVIQKPESSAYTGEKKQHVESVGTSNTDGTIIGIVKCGTCLVETCASI